MAGGGVRATILAPGVLFGLMGTLLIGIGGASNIFAAGADGWAWLPLRVVGSVVPAWVSINLFALGHLLLLGGWWLLRPATTTPALRPGLVLVIWSAPLLLAPPASSGDAFLYADLGWIQHMGRNPYDTPLGSLGGPYASSVSPMWLGEGVVYPPLSLLAHHAGVLVGGLHPYGGVLGQRALAMIGVVLIASLLPAVGRALGTQAPWTGWFGIMNPLLVTEFVGGAHNDALMVGTVVLALWVGTRSGWWLSPGLLAAPMLIGLAMGFKQQAGLAVIAVAGIPVMDRLRSLPLGRRLALLYGRSAVAGLVAAASFIGVSFLSGLGFGWTRWLGSFGQAKSLWALPLEGVGVWPEALLLIQVLVACFAVMVVVRHAAEPVRTAGLLSLLLPFLMEAAWAWYLVLGLMLLAVCPIRPRFARFVGVGGEGGSAEERGGPLSVSHV